MKVMATITTYVGKNNFVVSKNYYDNSDNIDNNFDNDKCIDNFSITLPIEKQHRW